MKAQVQRLADHVLVGRRLGNDVDGVEMYDGFFESFETDYLGDVKTRIEGHGLEMPMLCFSPDFT